MLWIYQYIKIENISIFGYRQKSPLSKTADVMSALKEVGVNIYDWNYLLAIEYLCEILDNKSNILYLCINKRFKKVWLIYINIILLV